MRRICVVLPRGLDLPTDWIDAVRARVPVFRESTLREALGVAEELGASLPAALIIDAGVSRERAELARRADADAVGFADRALEVEWQRGVLGYGDAATA